MSSIKHERASFVSNTIIKGIRSIIKRTGNEIWEINLLTRKKEFSVPHFIVKKYRINYNYIKNHSIVTLLPKAITSNKHIIYFHGGGFVTRGIINHWVFIDKVISKVKCKATYIDYPLAPKHGHKSIQEMVLKSYKELIEEYPDDEFILMGDSAGGGLAVTLAQKLIKNTTIKQPKKIIMFSPWVDLEMNNNKIPFCEKKDFTLLRKKLIILAKYYAKSKDLYNPIISPIYGEFEGLCDMELYVGSSEILYPDCIKLHYRAHKAGISINTYVYHKMPHVWVMMPCFEARRARKNVINNLIDK